MQLNPESSQEPLQFQRGRRLDSWKAIAAYFQRDVRTVQRWERTEGLPVHRHSHEKGTTVHAYEADLELWSKNRSAPKPSEPTRALPQTRRKARRWAFAIIGAIIAAGIAAISPRPPAAAPEVTRFAQLTSDGRVKVSPVVTDGSRIYFVEHIPGGRRSLASVPVNGGDTLPIPVPFADFGVFDVSVRRSEFLIGTAEPGQHGISLWTLPLSGGTPHRVGNLIVNAAAWAKDGERLAYSNAHDLFLAGGAGDHPQKLATFAGNVGGISWSPDNRLLRASVQLTDRFADEIWEVGSGGGKPRRVIQGWENLRQGSWTPDGAYYFFIAQRGTQHFIYASRQRNHWWMSAPDAPALLGSTALFDFESQVASLDGKQIFGLGSQHRPELVRYDAKLGELVPYLHGIPAYWSVLSPNGRSAAYISLPQHTLWRAKPDGSEPVQLTFAPLEADGFAWSPDGAQIALRARRADQKWKIYLISSESGSPRMLTTDTRDEGIPSWAPDGKRIVFGEVPAVEWRDDPSLALHVLDLKTGQTSDLPSSKSLWTARWSPNGRYIAALTLASRRLKVFDLETGKWLDLDSPPINNPAWSHDSAYIYFDSIESNRAIYRLRLRDGHLERIVDLEGAAPTLWGSGLGPDDSPLVTRDVGFTEIYSLDLRIP